MHVSLPQRQKYDKSKGKYETLQKDFPIQDIKLLHCNQSAANSVPPVTACNAIIPAIGERLPSTIEDWIAVQLWWCIATLPVFKRPSESAVGRRLISAGKLLITDLLM